MKPEQSAEPSRRHGLPWHGFAIASFTICVSVLALGVFLGDPDNLPVLLYPVVVTLAPVALRERRWPRIVATVLIAPMATFIFSVGIFYAPATLLMLIAACAPTRIDWNARCAAALSDDERTEPEPRQ